LRDSGEGEVEFAGEDVQDAWEAETALATPHARAGAALDGVHGMCAAADGVDNFGFRDLFATANNLMGQMGRMRRMRQMGWVICPIRLIRPICPVD